MIKKISITNLIKNHNSIAFIDQTGFIQSKDYADLVIKISNYLLATGIERGDRIAIFSENSYVFVLLILALINIGAIAVPINTYTPIPQLQKLKKQVNIKKIFISRHYSQPDFNNKEYTELEQIIENISLCEKQKNHYQTQLNRDALIIFTSGSTGKPKVVLLTLGNLYYNALGANVNIPFKKGERWLLTLPLYHIGGIGIIIRALISGGTVVIPDRRNSIADHIKIYNVTHISLVSTQLYRLLNEEKAGNILAKMKAILIGGGPIDADLVKQCIRYKIPLFTSYGSTEMASQITTTSSDDRPTCWYTSGRVLQYRKIKISKEGEILVKGKTLCKGYINNNRISLSLNDRGWFQSGDLGEIDIKGYLNVLGRKDNMFISGGENIYPEEIEANLLELPEIENALVVPVPEKEFGSVPFAFIKTREKQKINETQLQTSLKDKLAAFKIPKFYRTWPENYIGMKPDRNYFTRLAVQDMKLKSER